MSVDYGLDCSAGSGAIFNTILILRLDLDV